MMTRNTVFHLVYLFAFLVVFGCAGPSGPVPPPGPAGVDGAAPTGGPAPTGPVIPPQPPYVPMLDHFKVYVADDPAGQSQFDPVNVFLKGQFDRKQIKTLVSRPLFFANPVAKNDTPIIDMNAHLVWYLISQETPEPDREVIFVNQFFPRPDTMIIGNPKFLLVPAEKVEPGSQFPASLDHYKCYEVKKSPELNNIQVNLSDQFVADDQTPVFQTECFCVPVIKKLVSQPGGKNPAVLNNPVDHLTVYTINNDPFDKLILREDQFVKARLQILSEQFLCVPTLKVKFKGLGSTD